MLADALAVHPGLADARRLPVLAGLAPAASIAVLIGAGAAAAAASALIELKLGIPGHAIVLSVFPMALGLALAPRRGGGTVMGTSALATLLAFRAGGVGEVGVGAITSLVVTGLLLDLALRGNQRGARLYLAFVAAAVGGNEVAFVARAAAKYLGLEAHGKPFAAWWPTASVSYLVCGVIAGLLAAATLFRAAPRREARA